MDKNIEIAVLFDRYKSLLTQKQAEAMELYYCEDLSLGEIGENLGISRQGVRDAIKRGEDILYHAEDNIKMCAYVKKIEEVLDFIRNEAKKYPEQGSAILKAISSLDE